MKTPEQLAAELAEDTHKCIHDATHFIRIDISPDGQMLEAIRLLNERVKLLEAFHMERGNDENRPP